MKIRKTNQSAGIIGNIVDNLESESKLDALSAHMGTFLNQKIKALSLAKYGGSNAAIDPNTTTYPLILTNHANKPSTNQGFYYIETIFYGDVSNTSNRTQIAYGYTVDEIWIRNCFSDTWTTWLQVGTIKIGQLGSAKSFNDVLAESQSSIYVVYTDHSTSSGYPTGAYPLGMLITIKAVNSTSIVGVFQIYIPVANHYTGSGYGIYIRDGSYPNQWGKYTGTQINAVE